MTMTVDIEIPLSVDGTKAEEPVDSTNDIPKKSPKDTLIELLQEKITNVQADFKHITAEIGVKKRDLNGIASDSPADVKQRLSIEKSISALERLQHVDEAMVKEFQKHVSKLSADDAIDIQTEYQYINSIVEDFEKEILYQYEKEHATEDAVTPVDTNTLPYTSIEDTHMPRKEGQYRARRALRDILESLM